MKRIVFAAVAALACIGAGASAQQEDMSKVEIKTTDLGHGLYMLEGNGGNITVAVTADGVIMVDDQFAPLSAKIKAAIAKLSPKPVRYLINTHYHPDHTGGNENFAKDGATIIGQENERKRLETGKQPAAALPIITFGETMDVHLGDKTAELKHMAPAHTDGDAYVYFRSENVLATGDIFGSFRFPNMDARTGGGINGVLASANTLLALVNDNTLIVPGHGPLAKKTDLVSYRDMLQDAHDRVAKLIAEGKTADQVVQAKPMADWYAKRGGDDMRTDNFVRAVYLSLKPAG